jgi:Golgi nucleoside diphosphatase
MENQFAVSSWRNEYYRKEYWFVRRETTFQRLQNGYSIMENQFTCK